MSSPTPEDGRMAQMRQWLASVCAELGLDPALLDGVTDELLDLIRDVAHGPSRPGAPLTAFLVGLAAAGGGQLDPSATRDAVRERVSSVDRLVWSWSPT